MTCVATRLLLLNEKSNIHVLPVASLLPWEGKIEPLSRWTVDDRRRVAASQRKAREKSNRYQSSFQGRKKRAAASAVGTKNAGKYKYLPSVEKKKR